MILLLLKNKRNPICISWHRQAGQNKRKMKNQQIYKLVCKILRFYTHTQIIFQFMLDILDIQQISEEHKYIYIYGQISILFQSSL